MFWFEAYSVDLINSAVKVSDEFATQIFDKLVLDNSRCAGDGGRAVVLGM